MTRRGIGDSVARTFDSGSRTLLLSFAEMLMRDAEKQAQYNKQLETLSEASFDRPQKEKESGLEPDGDGIILCDVSQERWPILFANDWWQALTGITFAFAALKGSERTDGLSSSVEMEGILEIGTSSAFL